MERLDLHGGTSYDALDAAVHVARYAIVRNLCRGKRVLDLACGQGYGTTLLLEWGASSVVAVDASSEAITLAEEMFGHPRVRFMNARVEDLSAESLGEAFDLAVCIETIEHMEKPQALLRLLRAAVIASGTIVVTCPNDHWYYPSEKDANPYHLRKFTFDEFRALAESELGIASLWMLGTGALGFCSVPVSELEVADETKTQRAMLRTLDASVQTVPSPMAKAPSMSSVAYFVGIWGELESNTCSGAIFAIGMDELAAAWSEGAQGASSTGRVVALEAELRALLEGPVSRLARAGRLDAPLDELAKERSRLLAAALNKENLLLRDRVEALVEREQAATRSASRADEMTQQLFQRIQSAEELSSKWATELNAERSLLAAAEARAEQWMHELDAARLKLSLLERERAALRLRLDEFAGVDTGRRDEDTQEAQAATLPRLRYRVYRRLKRIVPGNIRKSLGPRIARWLPRP